MLIAGLGIGEFVRELQQRAVRVTVEPIVTRELPGGDGLRLTSPYVKTIRSGARMSSTSPEASTPFEWRISIAPPGRASIVEPAPHHAAHSAAFVKNPNTVSRLARITTVRSRRWESAIIVPPT